MKKEFLSKRGSAKDTLPTPQRETRGAKPPLAKFPSYRTQQAIAQFGKSARHPLCLAALELWRVKGQAREYAKDALSLRELFSQGKTAEGTGTSFVRTIVQGRKAKRSNPSCCVFA
jgi:hypothetical protein